MICATDDNNYLEVTPTIERSDPEETPYINSIVEVSLSAPDKVDATGISNENITRTRRYKALPDMWKRNLSAKPRHSGQEYVNRANKVVQKKVPRPVDCGKCRLDFFVRFFSIRQYFIYN